METHTLSVTISFPAGRFTESDLFELRREIERAADALAAHATSVHVTEFKEV